MRLGIRGWCSRFCVCLFEWVGRLPHDNEWDTTGQATNGPKLVNNVHSLVFNIELPKNQQHYIPDGIELLDCPLEN